MPRSDFDGTQPRYDNSYKRANERDDNKDYESIVDKIDKPYITQSIIIPREYRCTIYNCDNIYKGKNYNDICGECNDKFTRLDLSRKEIWQAKRKPRTLNN